VIKAFYKILVAQGKPQKSGDNSVHAEIHYHAYRHGKR